jgi:hypothetical protein
VDSVSAGRCYRKLDLAAHLVVSDWVKNILRSFPYNRVFRP